MKRIAIFAHYDIDGKIDEYVISYLKNLRKNVDKILFVSDGEIGDQELSKLDGIIFDSICEPHGEYDFGSYKRGYSLLDTKYSNDLSDADELMFANDSCYCLRDFDSIFKDMETNDCDVWSLGDDYENGLDNRFYTLKNYYLQSYFIVFRKGVFLEMFFKEFLSKIKKLANKSEIIFHYEEGLGRLLLGNNKKLFAYFSAKRVGQYIYDNYINLTEEMVNLIKKSSGCDDNEALLVIGRSFDISQMNYVHSNKFYFLLKLGFPLIKRSIIVEGMTDFDPEKMMFFWEDVIKKFTKFRVEIVKNHLKRISKIPKSVDDLKGFSNQNDSLLNYTLSAKSLPKMSRSLFRIKYTRSDHLLIKILKIPVLHKRTKKQKGSAAAYNFVQSLANECRPDGNIMEPIGGGKRVAVFAHYDKEGFIEEYVVDYIKSLREVASNIIFVSDCRLVNDEASKLDGLVSKIIDKKHGEYDFGSYKRGLNHVADQLGDYDQLIMANDSCYLRSSLLPVFEEMEQKRRGIDFWGMTQNSEQFSPHIQSYFVVFNKNVFSKKEFFEFFNKVKKEKKKIEIVRKYEVGLTELLLKMGFVKDSFIPEVFAKNPTLSEAVISTFPEEFPLIKSVVLNRVMWRQCYGKSKA